MAKVMRVVGTMVVAYLVSVALLYVVTTWRWTRLWIAFGLLGVGTTAYVLARRQV